MSTHAAYMKQYRIDQRDGLQPLRFIRLPAEPLLSMLEVLPGRRSKQVDKAMWRARRSGTFTFAQADELCVTILRRHPAELYGDLWWAA